MSMELSYLYFQLCRKKLLSKKKVAHTVYGNKILDAESGGRLIEKCLRQNKPCLVARIGSVEMQAINAVTNVEQGLWKSIPEGHLKTLGNNAGFFPATEEMAKRFSVVYQNACVDIDVAALLLNRDEDYFYRKYAHKPQYITLTALEPYYCNTPWSAALEGKRVLVVHPFAKTIALQYSKRRELFNDCQVLPDFELITFKAVQTIGSNTGGFGTWFDALEYMKDAISKLDFDIAILGCGAYAFPLASHIKRIGKKAVVMGGATQLLFGIKGRRWDDNPVVSLLYNKSWVRPDEEDRPDGFENVEGGCYW